MLSFICTTFTLVIVFILLGWSQFNKNYRAVIQRLIKVLAGGLQWSWKKVLSGFTAAPNAGVILISDPAETLS